MGEVTQTASSDGAPSPRSNRRRQGRSAGRAAADDRNRQPRGDVRRQQILDAAVELFAGKGYRGTGVAALAARVGMTAPGLLYYFGTKERLLQEVVEERDRADAGEAGALGTLSSLRELGRHNVETATLTRLYVVLGAESLDREDPLHDFFVDRYRTARYLARSVLEAEREAKHVKADIDLDRVSTEIIATMMGLEIQWLIDPDRVDLGSAMEAYIDKRVEELAP